MSGKWTTRLLGIIANQPLFFFSLLFLLPPLLPINPLTNPRWRLFNYSGTFDITSGRAYLALYGWTTSPLIEYYVIESMGVHNPSDNSNATCYGTFESDGGTYEVWMKWRINAPSIIGDADFMQIW